MGTNPHLMDCRDPECAGCRPVPARKPSAFCGVGWVFLDPDGGWSYSQGHPKVECPDAEMVRKATEMEDHLWKEYQREWTKNNAHLFPPFPPKRESA
jgi:hypothetical protein